MAVRVDRGPGHLRVGLVMVDWAVRQPEGAPLLDGGTLTLRRHCDETGEVVELEHFAGLVLRRPGDTRAVGLARLGGRVPNPGRWRWRFLVRRVRWELAGRPAAVGSVHDGCERSW